MKNLRVVLVIVTLLIGIGASQQAAQAFFFTYSTGVQVQNLSSSVANVSLAFYNENSVSSGSLAATVPFTISANSSTTFYPLPSVSSGYKGSAVISSDQQVAAIVNILGLVNNNITAGASYIGFSQGNTSLQIPLLMKGNSGYNTWIKVQNAGSSTATAYVNYSDGTTTSQSIPAGSSATFDQANESHTPTVFSGVITSTQPIVATVVEESSTTMFAYNGFTAGSTKPVMPLINANNFGYVTGVQIQNGGGSSTDVTVQYTPSAAGTACTETQTIPAGQSKTFALFAFSITGGTGITTNCVFNATFVGTAAVITNTASAPLSVIVNQLNLTGGTGEAYSGFDPATATSKVVMPLIMDRNFGYFTGFSVMNVGTSNTDINCTFTNTSYTVSQSGLAPNSAVTVVQDQQIANGYVGSATCTGTTGSKIVGIVNELSTAAGDNFLVYEAINN